VAVLAGRVSLDHAAGLRRTFDAIFTTRVEHQTMTTAARPSIQMQYRTIDGLSIRYAESEQRGEHALLLSPWPESIYAYESIWSRLAERMHLVAVDLPGFGQSERRDALMSPRAMGEFVVPACCCAAPVARLVPAIAIATPMIRFVLMCLSSHGWVDSGSLGASSAIADSELP
jgi:pimeloyl-ACP methyl ester carboxylesterase